LHYTVKYLYDRYSFGIKVRLSGLCINRYRLLDADNRPLIALSVHLYQEL